jgi:hypothetical protein
MCPWKREPRPRAKRPISFRHDADSIKSITINILKGAGRPLLVSEVEAAFRARNKMYLIRSLDTHRSIGNNLESLRELNYVSYDKSSGRYSLIPFREESLDGIIDQASARKALEVLVNQATGGESSIYLRYPPTRHYINVLTLEKIATDHLFSEIESRVQHEEAPLMPGWFTGHLRLRGADVAAVGLVDSRGRRQVVLHIGKSTIKDVDIFIADRARLVDDLRDRCPRGAVDKLRGALFEAFDGLTELATFDLDTFADSHQVTLAPRKVFPLESDRAIMLETLRRVHQDGERIILVKGHVTHRAVMLETALRFRSEERAPEKQLELDTIIEKLKQDCVDYVIFRAKRARIQTGIGQIAFDRERMKDLLRSLGRRSLDVQFEFGDLSMSVDDLVRGIIGMIPLVDEPERVFSQAISCAGRFINIQGLVGKLLDAAQTSTLDANDTEHEFAADICRDMLQAAYDEAKTWGVLFFDERGCSA